jgi:hypothetical protein
VITAVDTSVLLDVFVAAPTFGARSASALQRCPSEGSALACDIVRTEVAELPAWFDDARKAGG